MSRLDGPWLTFAGSVLVVSVLYWAQPVLIPVALAALITFVLAPLVTALQRLLGRVAAVLTVVALVFSLLGLAGYALTQQMSALVTELPRYRANIREKIADVRTLARGGSVEQLQETLKDIQQEIQGTEPPKATAQSPLVVESAQVASLWSFPTWLGPAVGPLSTAGLVIVLVIFMLLEREDLRGRLIGLIGSGHLAVTTKALDEAGQRVSRQLLLQTLVNGIYGSAVALGLWIIGAPYPLLWGALGAALRFVPYLGPIAAAVAPTLISLAALPGWTKPLMVVGLFVALELFTNLVLETVLYAGAAGLSQVGLLVAVAGWTWLWGPVGLLLATPLTVCLVVLGKHVPGLDFLSTLMADVPALAPDVGYYQRLIARDQAEAWEIIQRHLSTHSPDTVFDALMVPALNYAERDRLEGRLTDEDERAVFDQTDELIDDVISIARARRVSTEPDREVSSAAPHAAAPSATPPALIGYPANGPGDELALRMLAAMLREDRLTVDVRSGRTLTTELITALRATPGAGLVIIDLPPSPAAKTRYVVRKLRAAMPDAPIIVGRWAPSTFVEDDRQSMLEAGATAAASTLLDTRDQIRQTESPSPAEPDRPAKSTSSVVVAHDPHAA